MTALGKATPLVPPVLPVTFSRRPQFLLCWLCWEAPSLLPLEPEDRRAVCAEPWDPKAGWPEGHTQVLGCGTAPGEAWGQSIVLSQPGGSSQKGLGRVTTNS